MTTALENARGLYHIGIRDGRPREAVQRFTGDGYTQHSTGVKDGADGFVEFFETFLERNPEREIDIVRSLQDGDLVFMHAAQSLNGGADRWITMDILQADDQDRMIEHWDVITEWTEDSQVDGPTEPDSGTPTAESKELVRRYIDEVLSEGRTDRLGNYVATDLVQHDPAVGDGLEALATSLAGTKYAETVLVVGAGDMVATLSRVEIDGVESAVMDLHRVADGRIVEHWTAREPVPPADQLLNGGKF